VTFCLERWLLYNVHVMKHLNVAEARARFGEILDEAEKGATVIIERRGVKYRIVAERARSAPAAPELFEFVDADVLNGQWTWTAGKAGVAFKPRRTRR
jgi:antitoxin (DNA-binding transcriptional repressor) of toxin-antitoxin stability system